MLSKVKRKVSNKWAREAPREGDLGSPNLGSRAPSLDSRDSSESEFMPQNGQRRRQHLRKMVKLFGRFMVGTSILCTPDVLLSMTCLFCSRVPLLASVDLVPLKTQVHNDTEQRLTDPALQHSLSDMMSNQESFPTARRDGSTHRMDRFADLHVHQSMPLPHALASRISSCFSYFI